MTRLAYIVGPNGNVITIADLPARTATRWVIRRKAEVVLAVHGGLLSLDEARLRYNLTVEEFYSWQREVERRGMLGLRTTQTQRHRYGDGTSGRAPLPASEKLRTFVDGSH